MRKLLSRRRTEALGALALVTTGVLGAVEVRHLRRRGADEQILQAGREAAIALREGYQAGSTRENVLFNMLAGFVVTFGGARAVTRLIRAEIGPFGNLVIGRRHIHHFVPGIVIALAAGGVSIGIRDEDLDKWLAVPFGAGAALVFDEAALLLALEDVYWSREGIVSVQLALAAAAALATGGIAMRVVSRAGPAHGGATSRTS